jgi:hypothetical protein
MSVLLLAARAWLKELPLTAEAAASWRCRSVPTHPTLFTACLTDQSFTCPPDANPRCSGRLYASLGVPSHGPPVPPGAVQVRRCADPRLGNGAFAAVRIPAGTYLGDYTGEMLDR